MAHNNDSLGTVFDVTAKKDVYGPGGSQLVYPFLLVEYEW